MNDKIVKILDRLGKDLHIINDHISSSPGLDNELYAYYNGKSEALEQAIAVIKHILEK